MIKSIKVDDVSVVRVGLVIICFNLKMLSSNLKSLLSVLLQSMLKSPKIIISLLFLYLHWLIVLHILHKSCLSNTLICLEVNLSNQLILILNFLNKFQSISFLCDFLSHI